MSSTVNGPQEAYGAQGKPIAQVFPGPVIATRDPTTTDINYILGRQWINKSTPSMWFLGSKAAGVATWIAAGSGAAGGIVTITGTSGGAESPLAGNFNILGDATDGVTVVGTANTETINIAAATTTQRGTLETSTDAESIAGASTAVAVTPASLAAKLGTQTNHGVLVGAGTAAAVTALTVGTDGQVLLGSTAADPVFTTLSSSNSSVTFATGAGTLGLTVTQASTTQLGGGTIATAAEAQAMTSTTDLLTPAGLASSRSGTAITFNESPLLTTAANTAGVATGATGAVNLMMLQGGEIMEQFILGAGQTIIGPRMTSTGLLTSLDLTNTEGAEYNFGNNANSKHAYTIGTSAAFYVELAVNSADVGGLDPFVVGFRKQQANAATFTDYTDFACIGARATTAADVCVIQTDLNNAGEVITNTTDAWTDGQTKTFKVLVSAAGVVTYTINGLAPTVTAAFTFDNADVVTPFIRHEFGAATPAAINWVSLKIGFQ